MQPSAPFLAKLTISQWSSVMIDIIPLYRNLCSDLSIDSSTATYIMKRLRNEGVAFAAVTLPALSKVVLLGIEIGNFYRAKSILAFTSIAEKGRSLRFFRSLLGKLFCLKTGNLLVNPDPFALYALRTLCEYVYKLAIRMDDHEHIEQTKKFVSHDETFEANIDWPFVDILRCQLETSHKNLFDNHYDIEQVLRAFPISPGPGTYAFADPRWYLWKSTYRVRSDQKYVGDVCFAKRRSFSKRHSNSRFVQKTKKEQESLISEILFVPKDSRGPRTIVREPRTNLLFQMSFFHWFTRYLQRKTHGRVNFTSQEVNRGIAKQASIDKKYSTIDLKNASDSVSYKVICTLFRHSPVIMKFLRDYRTKYVFLGKDNPNPIHRLRKLSGMGAGFTFPMMSFLAHHTLSTDYSKFFGVPYAVASSKIFTFGDDICVPTIYRSRAETALTRVGLVVNQQKSYSSGPFRESCGGDYLHGNDVAPPRLKLSSSGITTKKNQIFYESGKFVEHINELSAHCRVLHEHGLTSVQCYFEKMLQKMLNIEDLPKCSNMEFNGVVAYRFKTGRHLWRPESERNSVCVHTFVPKSPILVSEMAYRYSLVRSDWARKSQIDWKDRTWDEEKTNPLRPTKPYEMKMIKRKIDPSFLQSFEDI